MMTTGAILVGVALIIGVAAYIARPLFEESQGTGRGGLSNSAPHAQLNARRDAIYALIRELDTDFQTGKINTEDYQAQREHFLSEGVSILKQLDAVASQNGRGALEAEIEARVRALRQARSAQAGVADVGVGARFCTQCGQLAEPQDRFCAFCGNPLKGGVSE
jgi:hypothetical protein